MIAVARQESGTQKLEGHDIMALELFDPEVRPLIIVGFHLFYSLSHISGMDVTHETYELTNFA